MLTPPLGWFLVIYLASLVGDAHHGVLERRPVHEPRSSTLTLANFREHLHRSTYLRSSGARSARRARHGDRRRPRVPVRVLHGTGRVAPRRRRLLFMAVLLPLWASYLARVYAWIVILTKGGTLNWAFQSIGLPPANIGYTQHRDVARVLVHLAAVHDHPGLHGAGANPRLAARGGGRPRRQAAGAALRDVVLPLALPGIVAGLDLHVLAHARRLHHAAADRRHELEPHRQRRSTTTSAPRTTSRSRPRLRSCRS